MGKKKKEERTSEKTILLPHQLTSPPNFYLLPLHKKVWRISENFISSFWTTHGMIFEWMYMYSLFPLGKHIET